MALPASPSWAVSLIGGGKMGRALAEGLLRGGVISADRLFVADPSPETRRWWSERHPLATVSMDNTAIASASDVVILAVKPQSIEPAAGTLRSHLAQRLVISVIAGLSIERLKELLGTDRIVRVMPNTPCLIGAGVSAFTPSPSVTDDQRRWVYRMLESVGAAVLIPESQMDAVTGLSGSGPAYIYQIIEALSDGGVLAGLPRTLALQLAAETVRGAADMVLKTGLHPGQLKDDVASPGGTTIHGLAAMERGGVRAALIDAVIAAANRSRDLASIDARGE
jgi:pyrroline-5-carboxylate reductase